MNSTVRTMAHAALMTALLCLISPIALPVGPVAMTLQTFAVALAGYTLAPRAAMMSAGAYLLLGACGLPVFSGFTGGFGVLAGPTGGFLLAFVPMAGLCSLSRKKSSFFQFAAGLLALILVDLTGAAWLSRTSGLRFFQALITGAVPFLWKDALSIAGAIAVRRLLIRRRLL